MIIDSNIIIYIGKPIDFGVSAYLDGKFYFCSQISYVEALGYHSFESREKEMLEYFFESLPIVSVSDDIIKIATKLRQSKKMTLGDSIIAATALYWGFPLFTNNEKDFAGITGLQLIPLSSI